MSTTGPMGVRTADEVLARIAEVRDEGLDMFGAAQSRLIESLPWEQAYDYLNTETRDEPGQREKWEGQQVLPEAAISDYLPFAVNRAYGHRGLSAGRSVDHLRALTWLMGDEPHRRFTDAEYQQYGMPQLKVAAELVDAPWPPAQYGSGDPYPEDEAAEIARMADSDRCEPFCDAGCA